MKKVINKKQKCCAMCKNWNGGKGPNYIEPNGRLFCYIDSDELHDCMMNGVKRNGLFGGGCSKFSPKF